MAPRNKNDVRKRLNMAEKNPKESQKQTNSQGVHPLTSTPENQTQPSTSGSRETVRDNSESRQEDRPNTSPIERIGTVGGQLDTNPGLNNLPHTRRQTRLSTASDHAARVLATGKSGPGRKIVLVVVRHASL